MTTIEDLPESIVLDIFKTLNYRDLCMCSMICQRWYRISRDQTLRKAIDLRCFKLSFYCLQSFIRHHASPVLRQIYLSDNTKSSALFTQLEELFVRSPNLEKLYLQHNKSQQLFDRLPMTLVHLSLRGCQAIDIDKLVHVIVDNTPHLCCLDLSGVLFLTSNDLCHLTKLKSLRALYLEGCLRVNNGGLEEIIDILPQLEILDIEMTDISNNGLQIILEHCIKLKHLYVGHNDLSDAALKNVKRTLPVPLESLCIYDTQLTVQGITKYIMDNINPWPGKLVLTIKKGFFSYFNQAAMPCVKFDFQKPGKQCCYHAKSHKC